MTYRSRSQRSAQSGTQSLRAVGSGLADLLFLGALFLPWITLRDPVNIMHYDLSGWSLSNQGLLVEDNLTWLFAVPLLGLVLVGLAIASLLGVAVNRLGAAAYFLGAVLVAMPLWIVISTHDQWVGLLVTFLPDLIKPLVNNGVALDWFGGLGATAIGALLCLVLGALTLMDRPPAQRSRR